MYLSLEYPSKSSFAQGQNRLRESQTARRVGGTIKGRFCATTDLHLTGSKLAYNIIPAKIIIR